MKTENSPSVTNESEPPNGGSMQPDGSTALIQAREDRELMKRVVIICKRSGNRELLEQASFESRKLYAQIYYLEKVKPENGELCDLRGEKERTK